MGLQMASAYVGITVMPFLFGKFASHIGYSSLLWFISVVLLLKMYLNYEFNRKVLASKKVAVTVQ